MSLPQTDVDATIAQAVRIVLAALPQDRQPRADEITGTCDLVHMMQTSRGVLLDRQVLQREVEALVSVWQDESVGLENLENHVEWLTEARAERSWEFWERYRRFLEDTRGMPREVVRRLDQSTDRVLRRVEDPLRPGQWRRDGLVVGQVQSGKTGNYVGLACKAADAGYKLIVILAGIHNSLRSQTQLRVDEGLLGFDTQYQQRSDEDTAGSAIGVGAMPGAKRLKIASLTTSAEKGDFGKAVAKNTNLPIGDFPVVLVVKKHTGILGYLRKWIVEVEGTPTADGGPKKVRDVPLLIIDDEADHASVNTKDEDTDPSKVNGAIRELLASFDRAAYIGYTATPFANIYIDPEADHEKFGADLFPNAFIESLRAPSNYFGPERVFGIKYSDPDTDDVTPLPVLRSISDEARWMPDKHKKDWVPPSDLPRSLQNAINSFVLSCAARRARGQHAVHNSMLVHVTRFVDVQQLVAESVDDYVSLLRDRLRDRYSGSSQAAIENLHTLWRDDFVETTAFWQASEASRLTWDQVLQELMPTLDRIEVRAINGTSQDALTYYEHRRTGLSVIAIGGDKLSRGLTLEGLTVSYYLRASRTYDTLLQMGRWFGFRPGFEDLCRLYTTPALRNAYSEIASADDELRRDFDEMAALGLSPSEFGLRVRTSSLQLGITAANKMRRSQLVKFSFSADIPETTVMHIGDNELHTNVTNLRKFLDRLDTVGTVDESNPFVWSDIPAQEIIEGFLDGYVSHPRAVRVRPKFIAAYIARCAERGELGSWTVKVANKDGRKVSIGERQVGLVKRRPSNSPEQDGVYSTRRVVSPSDELVDLDLMQREQAMAATRAAVAGKIDKDGNPVDPKVPSGRSIRLQRRHSQALLLIYPLINPLNKEDDDEWPHPPVVGFAISFPKSPNAVSIEYRVNDIWSRQEMDDLLGSDDE
jgi:hypothetical protein